MPKSDNLKDRLNELFSSVEVEGLPEAGNARSQPTPPVAAPGLGDISEAAFENLAVGMLLTGIDGRFLRVNSSFCEMLGYAREEILGRNFQSLTYEEDLQVGADAMRDMLGGKTNSARIQKRYIHKEKRLIWVELNITLVRELEGKPVYFVVVVQDITRQRKTAALLEERVQELAVFNEIIRSVAQKIDLNDALEATYQYVSKLMPLDAFIVALYDEKSKSVQYPLVYDEGVRYAPVTSEFAPDTRIG
jgi:PAS domain S-box-containing protein